MKLLEMAKKLDGIVGSNLFFVGCGFASLTGIAFVFYNKRLQSKIRASDFYNEGLEAIYNNAAASKAIGIPFTLVETNVYSAYNYWQKGVCKLTIPVRSNNGKSYLYLKGVHVGDDNKKKCKLVQLDVYLDYENKTYVVYEDKDLKKQKS